MSMAASSTNIDQLAAALVKCQQQLKVAVKDSVNPFFKSKYAGLESVWEACRDALTSNGLSVIQLPGFEDGVVQLTTVLLHTSGQWIQGTAGAPAKTPDAQGVGSALTYLRRYALAAVVGVVSDEDDDGQAATNKAGGVVKRAAAVPKEPVPSGAPPAGVTEDGEIEGPTRDTPWQGPGPTHGKSVKQWAIGHLRMADDGRVKVPDEWVQLVRTELKARAFKAKIA